MPRARTTRTPCPNSEVDTVYHTINTCQASEYLARLHLLYTSDPTDDTRDELLKACLARLKKTVRYHVHCRGICPSFMEPEAFADDSWSLSIEKFWRGMCSLHRPKQIPAWLDRVAYSAVVEEYRSRVRRVKGCPVRLEGIEKEVQSDGD